MTFHTVTLDLDGTLLPDTTLFAQVLGANGRGDDVAASDARFFAGDTTLRECFEEQWAWFQPLTPGDIHRALRKAAWLPGIRDGIARLMDAGLTVRLLTDQPSSATDYAGRWGCAPAISSPVTVEEGQQVALDFREDKLENLRSHGLDPSAVCHVGNGANDVPIWQAGATGIAVFAEPDVAAAADVDLGRPDDFGAVVDAILAQRGGK